MPSSCKEIRAALAECLQESECVMVQRHTAAECLRSPLAETLPTKCQQLKKGFGDCRRGMIDMRLRFRGNQPVTFKSLEDSEGGKGYQLYAGKAAFAGSMKETSGDEKEAPDWRDVENQRYRQQQQQQGQRQEQGKQGKPSQQQEQPPPPPPPPTSPQQQQESSGQSGQTKQSEQSKKSWSLWS